MRNLSGLCAGRASDIASVNVCGAVGAAIVAMAVLVLVAKSPVVVAAVVVDAGSMALFATPVEYDKC